MFFFAQHPTTKSCTVAVAHQQESATTLPSLCRMDIPAASVTSHTCYSRFWLVGFSFVWWVFLFVWGFGGFGLGFVVVFFPPLNRLWNISFATFSNWKCRTTFQEGSWVAPNKEATLFKLTYLNKFKTHFEIINTSLRFSLPPRLW